MKKIVSIALALVLSMALSVSAFAAPTAKETLTKQINASAVVTAEQKAEALKVVNAMSEAQAAAVDVPALKAIAKPLQEKVKAGTVTAADINTALASVNATLAAANVKVEVSDLVIDASTGKVSAKTAASVNGTKVAETSVSTGWAVTPAPAPGTSVIKATGSNVEIAAIAVALTVVSVLGVAAVKARKMEVGA